MILCMVTAMRGRVYYLLRPMTALAPALNLRVARRFLASFKLRASKLRSSVFSQGWLRAPSTVKRCKGFAVQITKTISHSEFQKTSLQM